MHCEKPTTPAGVIKIIIHAIGGVVLAGLFALVLGYVVMLLWNWVVVAVFGIGKIGFWQAVGVILLSKILFGGIPCGPGHKTVSAQEKTHLFHDWHSEKEYMVKNRHMLKKFWECEGKKAFEEFKDNYKEDSSE